jgi:hypothetical protein
MTDRDTRPADQGSGKGYNTGWTPRPMQRPTETPVDDGPTRGEVKREHPAFGMIGATRFTGATGNLFASPIKHNAGVMIRLVEAYEQGNEYGRRQFGGKHIVEVTLSEAQWASFVTAMNVGSGVPCTISYRQTGEFVRVPGIDDDHPHVKRAADIKDKAKKDLALLTEFATKFRELLERGKAPTKGELRALYDKYILHAVDHAPGNYEFLANIVTEHMEETLTAARAEIEGYVLHTALKFPGLADAAPEIPALPAPKESDQ